MQYAPRHRPYLTAATAFEIGLKPMAMAEWLDTGPDHAAFMAAKRARLAGLPPLFYRSLDRSRPAQAELLTMVVAQLLAQHHQVFTADEGVVRDLVDGSRHVLTQDAGEPLAVLSGMVEEDFVLFEREAGADIVTAISNAYTSSGRIVACLGRDMRFAHEPVPGLNEALAARIDRVIANVQVEKPVVRFNWFLTPIASRLFPDSSHDANHEAAEQAGKLLAMDHRQAGALLWLRVERQSFVRLPQTGALAFGIHTYSDRLDTLAGERESLEAIHRLLGAYSVERLRYGGMLATRDATRQWIEGMLAA